MSYKLQQPYTEKERIDFIVKYNHNNGLRIEETEQALYALEVNEIMALVDVEEEIQVEVEPAVYEDVVIPAVTEIVQVQAFDEKGEPVFDEEGNPTYIEEVIIVEPERVEHQLVKEAVYETQTITVQRLVPVLNPNYEAEQAEKEAERIANLKVTKRVFALALQQYGITYTQLKELIATNDQAQLEWDLCIELERSNPLLDVMALQMGITSEQLDYIFRKANGEEVIPPVEPEVEEPTEEEKSEIPINSDIADEIISNGTAEEIPLPEGGVTEE